MSLLVCKLLDPMGNILIAIHLMKTQKKHLTCCWGHISDLLSFNIGLSAVYCQCVSYSFGRLGSPTCLQNSQQRLAWKIYFQFWLNIHLSYIPAFSLDQSISTVLSLVTLMSPLRWKKRNEKAKNQNAKIQKVTLCLVCPIKLKGTPSKYDDWIYLLNLSWIVWETPVKS